MASNYTENYGLCQWEATDQVLREEFNQDNAKVDGALDTLEQAVTRHGAELETQAAAIAKLGNCQLYYTTYEGNGLTTKPRSHTFPAKPLVVMVFEADGGMGICAWRGATHTNLNYSTLQRLELTWGERDVSWYVDSIPDYSFNKSGEQYQIIALLDMST